MAHQYQAELKTTVLQPLTKKDYLKKMIGDTVLVLSGDEGDWHGSVSSVLDDETVIVINGEGDPRKVDIYKLRSL